ncbi:adhesion G protein-coupled receptor L3-like [Halichondria panicea]|uniref:adhesion G protein-coupled receptor L3-like n=1 Tax=Halichondria panicea TaxID=6063 RepID=UPI00312B52B1
MCHTLATHLLACLTIAVLSTLSLVEAQGGPVMCGNTMCLNGGTCVNSMCDCSGIGYTGVQCQIAMDCPMEAAAGILWRPNTPGMLSSVAAVPCNIAFLGLQAGTITRTCTNGTWSPLDYSGCSFNAEQVDSRAFMLIWIPLAVDEPQLTSALPQVKAEIYRLLSVSSTLPLSLLSTVEVTKPTTYLSATFLLTLAMRQPSPGLVATLNVTGPAFEAGQAVIGGLATAVGAPWGVQGFYEADSCLCKQPTDQVFLGLCEDIVPIPACSCKDMNNTCRCFFPYFIGDGETCTVDEDGDGYPNVLLESCADLSSDQRNVSYCIPDNCPSHYNPAQDVTKCIAPLGFSSGCLMEEDEVWEVSWGNTLPGQTDMQRCPQGPGFITRDCSPKGWMKAQADQCGSYRFSLLQDDIMSIFDDDDIETRLVNSVDIFDEVRLQTAPLGRRVSILPSDLDVSNQLINTILELLEEIQEGEIQVSIPNFNVLDIMSNILASTNLNGWISIQQRAAGSRQLLDIAERYGLYLSRSVGDDDNDRRLFQSDNVVLSYRSTNPDTDGDHMFPEAEEDINSTFTSIPAQISIPMSFLREQMGRNRTSVPVSTILYRNMEQVLPVTRNSTEVASMVLSTQVAQRGVLNSPMLQTDPIVMKFVFDADSNSSTAKYICAFWQFSTPIGSGSWETDGVAMMSQEWSADNKTLTITCNATHLTSFAVLVDLSGTLDAGNNDTGVSVTELLALQIVSYIGCAISLICLLATIIFFVVMGSELFRKVHYFIHLNLSISLFLGYLMFVAGIETARANHGACVFVAVWLHYFFLASFSWMLCEGIMLYLMLVVVFSKLSEKWWFFLLVGYGLPVIPVVITVAVSTAGYGVYTEGILNYCWLPTSNGVIWGFVGPMLAIIMVNLVFLVIALVTVFRAARGSVKRGRTITGKRRESESMDISERKTLFVKLLTSTLVLLPLLGVTWILGIFTVNDNTTLFAWLFTIINSLQGLFIFFFHVVRSDKVWNSSRARSARDTLRKQVSRSSLKLPPNKRYTLERGETTASILNDDISSSQKVSVSLGDFEENLEEQLEMQESEQVINVPPDVVTACKIENDGVGNKENMANKKESAKIVDQSETTCT